MALAVCPSSNRSGVDAVDTGTLRGLGTLLIMLAFVALVIWAYSGKRKKNFDEAAQLPFADEPNPHKRDPNDPKA